ncbi:MAG: HPr family phosphocarrier protein [Gammaproteobacteria bacterium]|nr:HPr family phosphocarrier protein [Gammaproteobacteria bacterium]
MQQASTVICNQLGLHARAAAVFTKQANQFNSTVWLQRGERKVNGKSILGVMMLACGLGTKIEIFTEGDDELAALQSLIALVENKFGEKT